MWKAFLFDRTGATAIEYGLIAAVLSISIFTGIAQVQHGIEYLFSEPTSKLNEPLK